MAAVDARLVLPDRYRVLRHLANGGMAAVWEAQDTLLDRLVAVKVLDPGYAADPSARRRFTREARAAARVSGHPHVVAIYDIGEHDGQAFIVMEHFAGGTVRDRLRAGEPVETELALRWLEEAAGALDAAHAADVVHRDVKPGNLLLDDRGRLAVGDFGIASLAGETALTAAGQVVGTAAYLSPEQARGEPATAASDRYSLAVVAYELLCGRRPFGGETPVAQLSARLNAEPLRADGAAGAAADVLQHGLERDPQDRPPTATAFVAALRDALDGGADATAVTAVAAAPVPVRRPRTPAATPPPPPPPADGPVPPPPGPGRGRRRAVALAAVAALLAGAIAAAALTGDDDAPTAERGQEPQRTGERPATRQRTATEPRQTAPAQTQPAQTQPAADSPAELNDRGFALLPGDPAAAIPLLQQAVQGFREQGRVDETAYGYALYNLGWALRLAGRPAEAIPYLEERLESFDDRDDVVAAELERARADAGLSDPAPGNGKAKGGKKEKDD